MRSDPGELLSATCGLGLLVCMFAFAWYSGNSNRQTQPVGAKHPNAWGLYDMLGNVWEWTADWFDKDYYKQQVSKDPQGPASSPQNYKVVRGGAWLGDLSWLRFSAKRVGPTNAGNYDFGFRCAGELR